MVLGIAAVDTAEGFASLELPMLQILDAAFPTEILREFASSDQLDDIDLHAYVRGEEEV